MKLLLEYGEWPIDVALPYTRRDPSLQQFAKIVKNSYLNEN